MFVCSIFLLHSALSYGVLFNYFFLLMQVAGLPTNINFLLKLANHSAFENGQVETHFIEHHKDVLFADSSNMELAEEACKSATRSAMLAAACLCKMDINTAKGICQGKHIADVCYHCTSNAFDARTELVTTI